MAEREETRAQLQEIVGELEAVKLRLQGVKDSLPEPAVEGDLGTMEPRAEVRTVIECVLQDSIAPAIRDLQGAAVLVSDEA